MMRKTWNKLRSVIRTAGARSAPAVAVCVYLIVFPLVAEAKININTASLSDLTTLTGVGEVIGQRIIDARPFSSIGDIKSVKGIGDATYEKFKNDITVSNSSVSNDNESDDETDSDDTNNSNENDNRDDRKNKVPVKDLLISVPTYVFVDEEVSFTAEPAAGIRDRLIRYKWNFGDGSVGKGSSPTHRYKHPGTYVVVVESYYLGENIISKKELEVLPLEISLRRDISGGVTVVNNSDQSVNISGMKLIGQKDFVFPPHSWLLPGEELVIPASKVKALPINTITMHSSSGRLLASTYQMEEIHTPYEQVNSPDPTILSSKSSLDEENNIREKDVASTISSKKSDTTQTASVPNSIPKDSLPILGLIAVMGIGLLAVYSTVRQ